MSKLLNILLIFNIIFPINLYADSTCPNPVTLLNTGDKSPCKGYLFSEQQEQKMYLLDQKSKLMEQELDTKTKYIDVVNKELGDYQAVVDKEKQETELWRKSASDSTQKLIDYQKDTNQRNWLLFALGVLTTVGAGYAIGAAARH